MRKILSLLVFPTILGVVLYSCEKSDDSGNENEIPSEPVNGDESHGTSVDLGLSVLWATCNIGATAPEGYGSYLAWGEIYENSTSHTQDDCPFYDHGLNKYCPESNLSRGHQYYDRLTILEPCDDAAHVRWGGCWRMPTKAEWEELLANTTRTYSQINGVTGMILTSNINGKSIFLPASGRKYNSKDPEIRKKRGFYWSSSLDVSSGQYAFEYSFMHPSNNYSTHSEQRWSGNSVRPVYPKQHPKDVAFENLGVSVQWGTRNVGSETSDGRGGQMTWEEASKLDALGMRLPTKEEWEELLDPDLFSWEVVNPRNYTEIDGYRVISKINGASIFLPVNGYVDNREVSNYPNQFGCYWSSTPKDSICIHSLKLEKYAPSMSDYNCNYKLSVRLVKDY